jgi:5-methyltetrahydrofolate--homocysteine methyltransferase
MNDFSTIANAIYDGDQNTVVAQTKLAIEEGNTALEILEKGLMAGMDHVGKDFKAGDLFIPEVLVASRAMQAGMELLKPLLVSQKIKSPGKVILGTVKGDLHDIGKKTWFPSCCRELALRSSIWVGCKQRDLPRRNRHPQADLLGFSSLLTTTYAANAGDH